ncbi:hypothetical protein L873DRAFT_650966 [Choiromyces venosus 120613-1]|uniref:Uncharacterized protein n=1 Tax=Choiromyces venosus 120613-1 TaxID=1336337 RepID=A0A3N4IYU7_9PEZI|nr:hypothetical protein L873DRAFT_650966 [Choiromyces venosus 120613-1]
MVSHKGPLSRKGPLSCQALFRVPPVVSLQTPAIVAGSHNLATSTRTENRDHKQISTNRLQKETQFSRLENVNITAPEQTVHVSWRKIDLFQKRFQLRERVTYL